MSGIAVTLGGASVSHASESQHVVSLSTLKVEYTTAGNGVKKALFRRAVPSFIAPETSRVSIKDL